VRGRLVDSLEICFREGHGEAFIRTAENEPREFHYSERFACRYDGTEYAQPEPRLFSFNNPYGACPVCQGFGNVVGLDIDLVIPDPSRTLDAGAIDPWTKPQYEWAKDELQRFLSHGRHPMNVPFAALTKPQQRVIIDGKGKWSGVRGFFKWVETKKYKLHVRVFLSKYRGYTECYECGGSACGKRRAMCLSAAARCRKSARCQSATRRSFSMCWS
jgi:excinuclease ABC subunit A